jgi:hypothetical protein
MFAEELATLVKRHGIGVYRELLLRLTGKCFTEQKSRSYWEQVRGVGFGSCRTPSPDDVVVLRFARPFWPSTCQIRGHVRQVRTNSGNDVVYLGVEFENRLDDPGLALAGRGRTAQPDLPLRIPDDPGRHTAAPGCR